ncbi:MAG TPA: DivIVA domain-containing protein [Thermoanaerobaculia bacterium]|jgi:cell division initiation protein|nr:DivIVA domain-containing protein [Thermoanaerobaculia bacterium]HXM77702.1 DivIVA domain-containing protein [Thermoanaerobaculia bacterium]
MPHLTPLEIQKHDFSRKWKGFDPVEVESYLALVAEEMEELTRGNSELENRVRSLQEENAEHRERERILKETLVAAQRASEEIRGAATRQAELMIQEAQDSGERLTHNALQRAAEIEKAIHELKMHRFSLRLELQKMLELFGQVIENDREEDQRDRPLSYLTRKPEKGETVG